MTRTNTNQTLAERLYALLADTSALTILILGGYVISLAAEGDIMSAPWQIVLAVMTVPLLAAAAVSCGKHRENPRIRAVTWVIVVPFGIVNPLAWIGAFILITRTRVTTIRQHAAGD